MAGLKNKDKEFWTKIKEWDVMVLMETWLDENGWNKIRNKLPEGYNWEVQIATKKNKKGRAIME